MTGPGAPSIQERLPENHCWGCGPANPEGLRIRSYWEGEEAVCRFRPSPHHAAGPTHVVNGGIIATVIDCHSVCTAIADAYRAAGREIGAGPAIWCVTASLRVDYLAPAPIGETAELRARVRETRGRRRVVECTLRAGGRDCARGEVVAVEVGPGWRQPGG